MESRASRANWVGGVGALPARLRRWGLPGAPRDSRALPRPGGGRAARQQPGFRARALHGPPRHLPDRGRNHHIRSGKPPPEPRLIRLFPNMDSAAGASGELAGAGGGRGPRAPGPPALGQRCSGFAHGGGQARKGRGAPSLGRAGPPRLGFPRCQALTPGGVLQPASILGLPAFHIWPCTSAGAGCGRWDSIYRSGSGAGGEPSASSGQSWGGAPSGRAGGRGAEHLQRAAPGRPRRRARSRRPPPRRSRPARRARGGSATARQSPRPAPSWPRPRQRCSSCLRCRSPTPSAPSRTRPPPWTPTIPSWRR